MRLAFKAMTAGAILLAAALGGAPRAAAQKPLQDVTFALTDGGMAFLQLWIADKAGYFKEEGLKADLVNLQTGGRVAAAVASGSALLGSNSFSHVLESADKNGPLLAAARLSTSFPFDLVLARKTAERLGITPDMPGDEKMRRIKGVKIGYTGPGSSTDVFIQTVIRALKLSPSDNTFVPLGPGTGMVAALEAGGVDGFVWMAPFTDQPVKSGLAINVTKGLKLKEFEHLPFTIWSTSKTSLKTKAPLLTAALRALAKADKLAQDDPAKARAFAKQALTEVDSATFDAIYDGFAAAIPKRLAISKDDFDESVEVQNIVRGKGKLNVDFGEVVDTTIANEADKIH